jgi:hypothetical protein
MARGDSYQLQGQQGGIVVTSGGSASGPFRWVQVITDVTLTVITSQNLQNVESLETITIPAGIGIGGDITTIGIGQGTVIAYYA